MKLFHATSLVAALAAFAPSAQAVFFQNSTGLASLDQTITFESAVLPVNGSVTTQFQSFGVTFQNAFGNPDSSTLPNITGNRLGDFQSGIGKTGTFEIDFSALQSGAAFALVSQTGTTTFTALLNGVPVESATAATNLIATNNFFGFSNIAFNQLTALTVSSDSVFLMDNLQTLAAVPEPETLAMMLVGLGIVGATARRRRS